MRIEADHWDILIALLCNFSYAWCAASFGKKHLQGKPAEKGVFCGLLFCAYSIGTLLGERNNIPYFLYAAGCHLLLAGLVMAVFREEKEKKLLAAVSLLAMTKLIWNFCDAFLSVAWLLTVHRRADGWQTAVISEWGGRVITVLTCAAGILAINSLSKSLTSVFAEKRKSWYLCLAAPLACMVLIMDLISWAASRGIMVHDWGEYSLYENQLFSHGAMCIFTGLAIVASGFFVFGMDRIDREEKAGEQYRMQVRYYQMIEEQYSRMEHLRHDMKNHMIVLGKLVQDRQWDMAGSYLKEMEQAGRIEPGEEATGSYAMDALLYHKRCLAEKKGIRWQCDIALGKDFLIKEMDLCIIVGNILDNAIEACCRMREKEYAAAKTEEMPYIRVYAGRIKKCLLLEVRNSTDLPDSQTVGKSQKENPGQHGLGLRSVKAAAAVYNGTVETEVENGVFITSVLLPMYRECRS